MNYIYFEVQVISIENFNISLRLFNQNHTLLK